MTSAPDGAARQETGEVQVRYAGNTGACVHTDATMDDLER